MDEGYTINLTAGPHKFYNKKRGRLKTVPFFCNRNLCHKHYQAYKKDTVRLPSSLNADTRPAQDN